MIVQDQPSEAHVEPAIVWETIQNDLPVLAEQIRKILDA